MLNVTYIHHSGFIVETENNIIIFDYYSENGRIPEIDLNKYDKKNIFIFSSHSHSDHFDKKILNFNSNNVYFIFSNDISLNDNYNNITFVEPHKKYEIKNITVETLKSNDMGVAFIVNVDNKTIFHSGDLNWWHWNGEPDDWNDYMAEIFKNEINILKNKKIDIAFIPVDPRLEENYILSIDYIMNNVDVKNVMAMHFWDNFNVHDMLYSNEKTKNYKNKIIKIEKLMQKFIIE